MSSGWPCDCWAYVFLIGAVILISMETILTMIAHIRESLGELGESQKQITAVSRTQSGLWRFPCPSPYLILCYYRLKDTEFPMWLMLFPSSHSKKNIFKAGNLHKTIGYLLPSLGVRVEPCLSSRRDGCSKAKMKPISPHSLDTVGLKVLSEPWV